MLPIRAGVYLEAMAIKGYSAFSKALELLEPQHQIVYCHIQDARWESLTLLPEMQGVCGIAPAD